MYAILRLESVRLLRPSALLVGLFALVAGFLFAAFPGFADEADVLDEAMPPVLQAFLGFEEIHTIEGFVAGYAYPLLWVLFGGIFFAYVSAGTISREVGERRMDLTLSNPVSRESVVLQKIGAMWLPLVVLNAGMIAIVLAGVGVLGESIDPLVLTVAHLLSVPYLLVCAGIGLVFSVAIDRVETAQLGAIGVVFLLWLIEGIAEMSPDYEWVGYVSPAYYYDSSAIFVHDEYAYGDAGILLAAFLALVAVATAIFVRRDL
ncbi:ABC transporter permease [Halovivax gelatinilyticus]|uniref:ABC transporter permease n=1 Tax=Halovivax gelatinilyticus TaxID=2961597 RepID=UPI0020CA4171|nr:ABC transporter permease subunit [Halovivax gelatinilyticus]